MMNSDNSKFIAKKVSMILTEHRDVFRDSNKNEITFYSQGNDYKGMSSLLGKAMTEVLSIVKIWEEEAAPELEGKTPIQYYEGFDDIEDIVEMISQFESLGGGFITQGFIDSLKKRKELFLKDSIRLIEEIRLDEYKSFNLRQKSILHIAEIIASPEYVSALRKIFIQFDNFSTNDDSLRLLNNAFVAVGQPALDVVRMLTEDYVKKDRLYQYLLISLARIASSNKSEEIYQFLKGCFRNNKSKASEALALGMYGDGRAVSAIRGYVERNKNKISQAEYSQFREAVLTLGGNMRDLDSYFFKNVR